jgi:hypothetical protein
MYAFDDVASTVHQSLIHGSRLYTLKPDRDERLNELEILEFALPEDIEGMKVARMRGRGLHSSTFRLDVSTVLGTRWVVPVDHSDNNGSG